MRILGKLRKIIEKMESILIAYSGGVDSTFLLAIAKQVLGKKVLAVIAKSPTFPKQELTSAIQIARKMGVRHQVLETREIDNPKFNMNPADRCYWCKKELFSRLVLLAKKNKIKHVADGSNADDLIDYRPGAKALKELGIRSPLQEAGLAKKEIRKMSKKMGLPTWNKPAMACLASRVPYRQKITLARLKKIEKAENFIRSFGALQCRVRDYGKIASIEVDRKHINTINKIAARGIIGKYFNRIGFKYSIVDAQGYKTGKLNEYI